MKPYSCLPVGTASPFNQHHILGIGIDIVDIQRFKLAIQRHKKLPERLFSKNEQDYCFAKPRPHLHFAVRFAAKEAVVKALGVGLRGMKWKEIEVIRGELGKPSINLVGNAKRTAQDLGIGEIKVSLSFEKKSAVAVALAMEGND